MNVIKENLLNYIQIYQQNPLKLITLTIDIAIVVFVAYHIFKIFKESRAGQLVKGIAFLIVVTWLSKLLNLNILKFNKLLVIRMAV